MKAEDWLAKLGIKICNPFISYMEDRPLENATKNGEPVEIFPFGKVQVWTEYVAAVGVVLISFEPLSDFGAFSPCLTFCFINQTEDDIPVLVHFCKKRGLVVA